MEKVKSLKNASFTVLSPILAPKFLSALAGYARFLPLNPFGMEQSKILALT